PAAAVRQRLYGGAGRSKLAVWRAARARLGAFSRGGAPDLAGAAGDPGLQPRPEYPAVGRGRGAVAWRQRPAHPVRGAGTDLADDGRGGQYRGWDRLYRAGRAAHAAPDRR